VTDERILVVEDEPAVARGLVFGLESEGFQVDWVTHGRQAIESAMRHHPHLVILDLRLPDISGFDVCRQLRSRGEKMPIIMLTARDEEVDKILGLELGADDYIVKPYSLRELISRLRAQLRRAYGELTEAHSAGTITFGELAIDLDRFQVRKSGDVIPMTPTEFQILRYLARHPDHPVSREDIIQAVWGYTSDIGSDRTIDVHIRHLRQKIEDDPSRPQRIQTVRGVGYTFSP
jgi:DNA-binding response OmpR family regulator